jgi:hypothetical protein|tara:strand:- start:9713 stop:9886 length:174 start_codon:yes stop_codon:yes gene_type:complete
MEKMAMKKSIQKRKDILIQKKRFLRLINLTENEKRIMQSLKSTNLATRRLLLRTENR